MKDVYSNAWVTIVADGAVNARGGCFVASEKRAYHRYRAKVPYLVPDGTRSNVYVRPLCVPQGNNVGAHSDLMDLHLRSKLSTRGWIFQRYLLSRRLLVYSADEMSWECMTERCCECTFPPLEKDKLEGRNAYMTPVGKDAKGCMKFIFGWHEIVSEYTERDLTVDSNRLVALSGLAAAMQSTTLNTYFCGLWKEDIERELLWQVSKTDSRGRCNVSRKHMAYYAPSWAWSSVTGKVEWNRWMSDVERSCIKITGVDYVPAGPNRYGPAASGYIRVYGYVAAVTVREKNPVQSEWGTGLEVVSASTRNGDCASGDLWPDVTDDNRESHSDVPYAVLLVRVGYSRACGLLLRPYRSESETYKRVGFVDGLRCSFEQWSEGAVMQSITIL